MLKLKYIVCKIANSFIYKKWMKSVHFFLLTLLGKDRYYTILSQIETGTLKPIVTKRQKTKEKNIVYVMFDGRIEQAGLADNLRALSSVFVLCKKLHKDYRIVFNYPFQLEKYLVPNKYDWRIEHDDICYYNDVKDYVAVSYRDIFTDNNKLVQRNFLIKKLSETSKPIRLYTNTLCYDECFYENFHELFKPSMLLQELIKQQELAINSKFISVSFRFANLLGDIDDNYGQELDENNKKVLISKCVKAIELLHLDNIEYKILLTSDSITFLNRALKDCKYVYVIPGDIGHVGHNGNESVLIKTFLDLFMISKADCVYMLRSSIMYKSGFAQRAAMIGNKIFKEILIDNL